MNPQYIDLDDRIQTFDFNTANTKVTFAQRLMREHHWTKNHAERVIGEYRKFLLLAMVAGHRVVPSDQVDQVWHLNMLSSRSYWLDLCPNVLGKDLHHQPNPGGQTENINHFENYRQTLMSYERIFGQPAPDDIWPSAEIRFGIDLNFVRVNCHDYWLLKKTVINWLRMLGIVLIVALLLMLAGCNTDRDMDKFSRLFPSIILDFSVCFIVATISYHLFKFFKGGVAAVFCGILFVYSISGVVLTTGALLLGAVNAAPFVVGGIFILWIWVLSTSSKAKSKNRDFGDDLYDDYGSDPSNDSGGCSSDSGGCGGGCGGD